MHRDKCKGHETRDTGTQAHRCTGTSARDKCKGQVQGQETYLFVARQRAVVDVFDGGQDGGICVSEVVQLQHSFLSGWWRVTVRKG